MKNWADKQFPRQRILVRSFWKIAGNNTIFVRCVRLSHADKARKQCVFVCPCLGNKAITFAKGDYEVV